MCKLMGGAGIYTARCGCNNSRDTWRERPPLETQHTYHRGIMEQRVLVRITGIRTVDIKGPVGEVLHHLCQLVIRIVIPMANDLLSTQNLVLWIRCFLHNWLKIQHKIIKSHDCLGGLKLGFCISNLPVLVQSKMEKVHQPQYGSQKQHQVHAKMVETWELLLHHIEKYQAKSQQS